MGKSTLFNALIKEKRAIVDEYAGLTRDVISYELKYKSHSFRLSDTPGLDLPSDSELSGPIIENARRHLEDSSAVIFLMEYPGPESYDLEMGRMLRKLNVPIIIAVNKMDTNERMENMSNFYEMGFDDMVPISALNRRGISMLLDRLTEVIPAKNSEIRQPDITMTIVGRPNSGKSTLLNAFMGFERSVVSDVPGTTRDSVDDYFMYHGKLIMVVDTPGIRKKARITDGVEFYSFTRTKAAIKRSDVVIHLIDAEVGMSETDKKISDEIMKEGKPVIIAINKWDTVEKDHKTFEQYRDKMIFKFYRATDFPILSISARDKLRISRVLDKALDLKERAAIRIGTPRLNKALEKLQSSGRVPQMGHRIRIYYATQIDTVPPQFKFFVNNADYFRKDVVRYFEKSLQQEFNLEGIPVIIHLEGKKKRSKEE